MSIKFPLHEYINFLHIKLRFIEFFFRLKRCFWEFTKILFPINCCRFYSDGKNQNESPWGRTEPSQLDRSSSAYKVPPSLPKSDNGLIGGRSRFTENLRTEKSKVFPEDNEPWRKRIFDPGSEIMLQWNRVFIVFCLVALFVDPLYFYLPMLEGNADSSCVKTDLSLRIVVTFFRTIADIFYLLHVIIKFRTAYVAPSSRVFGRGELVMDPKKIAQRYIRSDFFIDLIATLPLPQVYCCKCYSPFYAFWFILIKRACILVYTIILGSLYH